MTFRIGQQVICVDDSGSLMDGLTEGQTYTVRWQGMHSYWPKHSEFGKPPTLCIKLVEIVRPATYSFSEPDMPYSAARFRPITEQSTDTGMAILRKLLKTKQREVA